MVYLSSPFSSISPRIEYARWWTANCYAAMLAKRGIHVYSPLTHSVPLYGMNKDTEAYPGFYLDMDIQIVRSGLIDKIIILNIPGWEKSTGIAAELEAATAVGIKIYHAHIVNNSLEVPCYKCLMDEKLLDFKNNVVECTYCLSKDGHGLVLPEKDDAVDLSQALFSVPRSRRKK